MNECYIIDFETLDVLPTSVVISFALLPFSESRYTNRPYTYDELLRSSYYLKFHVMEQVVTYNRTMNMDTIKWWNNQNDKIKGQIVPKNNDLSIDVLYQFLVDNIDFKSYKKLYSRGNTFDPIILESVLASCGKQLPMHWGTIRDTRSMIEGMSFGFPIKHDFIPKGLEQVFIKHNPIHDCAMDVMRMQEVARAISGV